MGRFKGEGAQSGRPFSVHMVLSCGCGTQACLRPWAPRKSAPSCDSCAPGSS